MVIEKYTFLQLALIIAILNWVAVMLKLRFLEYISKPATMIAIWAFVWHLRTGLVVHGSINWLLIAITLSLVSEIIQLLPAKSILPWFISSSSSNIAFILALLSNFNPIDVTTLLVVLMVGFTMYPIYLRFITSLKKSGNAKLRFPLLGFLSSISLMLISALLTLTSNHWENYRALLVSGGALLLFISSIWSMWDRFVEPLKFSRLQISVSFHLAQCLLCLGFLMTF